jgi:hypothetical protein
MNPYVEEFMPQLLPGSRVRIVFGIPNVEMGVGEHWEPRPLILPVDRFATCTSAAMVEVILHEAYFADLDRERAASRAFAARCGLIVGVIVFLILGLKLGGF